MQCLTLLNGFEEELGSLGPSVLKMCATAMIKEKENAGASNEIMKNAENIKTFELVQCKIKGKLQLKLLKEQYVQAAEKIITNIQNLLQLTRKYD